jgi:2,4-dienoyl-CoA reductase (NADPH2)
MACALTAAERGHWVTLFDAAAEIGGQFNLARRIPGKEEFSETLRYFDRRLNSAGVTLRTRQLCRRRTGRGGFEHVVLATGIVPRRPDCRHRAREGDFLRRSDRRLSRGRQTVAIIGAGGIGFDVAEFLTHVDDDRDEIERFQSEWGIDPTSPTRGGLKAPSAEPRRARSGCCSARRPRSATAWPRPPAGFAAPCSRSAACRCSPG